MATVPEIVTNKIIEQLDKGVVPWKKPWTGGFPINFVSKRPYSGINVLLLTISPFSSPFWMTYKQAKEKGGYIKKGEKSTLIVYRNTICKKEENEDGEETTKSYSLLRYYNVFNYEQTDGLENPFTEEEANEINPINCCEEVISNFQDKPIIKFEGTQALYSPSTDTIKSPKRQTFISAEAYYSTLFHELIHSTGHSFRLDRTSFKTEFGSEPYAKEELVAEIGASFLCGYCSIENSTLENSAAYIAGWLKKLKDDKRFIISAASLAQKAVNYIQKGEK